MWHACRNFYSRPPDYKKNVKVAMRPHIAKTVFIEIHYGMNWG